MYDPRRLGGPLIALGGIFLALWIGSVCLSAIIGPRSRWLPGDDPTMPLEGYSMVGGKLSGVLRQTKNGAQPPDLNSLGIFVGSSTIECGVDPVELSRTTPWHWLTLHGAGPNLRDFSRILQLVSRARLHPKIVVLVINRGMLAQSTRYLSDERSFDSAPIRAHIASRQLGLAKKDLETLLLVPWNRAFPHRTRINHLLRYALLLSKLRMFQACGLGVESLFPPERDPWSVPAKWVTGLHVPDDALDKQWKGLGTKDWFESTSYRADGPNAKALSELIEQSRERGVRLCVLLVPETKALRQAIPREADFCLSSILMRYRGPGGPVLIDLVDSLPDDLFYDLVHLNADGRKELTTRLAPIMRERLALRPDSKN